MYRHATNRVKNCNEGNTVTGSNELPSYFQRKPTSEAIPG
jgi:hypothetical protein